MDTYSFTSAWAQGVTRPTSHQIVAAEIDVSTITSTGHETKHKVKIGDSLRIVCVRRGNPFYGWKILGELLDFIPAHAIPTNEQAANFGNYDGRVTRFVKRPHPQVRLLIKNENGDPISVAFDRRAFSIKVYPQQEQ